MSSGFLISDFTMIDCVKRGTIAVIWIMSPPCKILEITAGPPEPAKSAAPDNMALKSADDAPIKTGSNSIAYLSKMRASLATNQGRQLRPMGENGNGTFLTCACSGQAENRAAIKMSKATLTAAFGNR